MNGKARLFMLLTYTVQVPAFVIITAVVLTMSLAENVRDKGKLNFKKTVSLYFKGVKEGHEINKANLKELFE